MKAAFGGFEHIIGLIEALLLPAFIAEGLGGADAGQARLDFGVDGAGFLLGRPGGPAHGPAAAQHHQQKHGDNQRHHQRKTPLDGKHHCQCADDGDSGDEQILRPVVGQLRQLEQVAGQAAHQLAGTVLVDGTMVFAGPGEPLGAFLAAYIGIECGHLVAGKTKVDILVTPIVTIGTGSLTGLLVGPGVSKIMTSLGAMINWGVEQQPFLMGIVVSVLMGMILTLPISSAALGIILNLSGLAAGAATVGCCCNMVGFAVASYRENKIGGLVAQGIGTSMLQVPNIVRKPVIWLPAILSSAILGPVGTMIFKMTSNATGSGMGTAGLVGQIMTWQTMVPAESGTIVLIKILLIQIILPAVITLAISEYMRKKGWIKYGDMKLDM